MKYTLFVIPCRQGGLRRLPSPNLIIVLENQEYMNILKAKLKEIKEFYRNLELLPRMTAS